MEYIVFLAIILLISWGTRVLIHTDMKKRRLNRAAACEDEQKEEAT